MAEITEELDLEDIAVDQAPETADTLSFREQIDYLVQRILRKESSLSFSSLNQFRLSPADFIKYKMKLKVETDAMIYGSMLHCKVLEPEDFLNRYYVIDDKAKKAEIGGAKPGATNAYKDWVKAAEILAKDENKTVVTQEDVDMAEGIANQVKFNTAAARILHLCPARESRVEWEHYNFKHMGFMDGRGPDAIFDLKSMPDAHPRKVEREINARKLYLQAAMYLHGDQEEAIAKGEKPRKKDYYIIAVDKKGGVSCHQLDKELLDKGAEEYAWILQQFTACVLGDKFEQSFEFFAERNDGIYTARKLW